MLKFMPADARAQLDAVANALTGVLGERLEGLYLHGSAAMGCFGPLSDIDLVGVSRGGMDEAAQRALADALLGLQCAPRELEISVLNCERIRPWVHPAPYEFHFSGAHVARFKAMLASERFDAGGAGDPDLAAHISVCRARGIALIGPDARDMFEPVPRADYLDSVLGDFDWLRDEGVPAVYAALNACRTLRLMREEGVYSKLECGLWALAQPELPGKGYVARALKAYGMDDELARDAGLDALIGYVARELGRA